MSLLHKNCGVTKKNIKVIRSYLPNGIKIKKPVGYDFYRFCSETTVFVVLNIEFINYKCSISKNTIIKIFLVL